MRLVSFDIDGTLIRRTTASLHLAERLGHKALVDELELGFFEGRVSASQFADAVAGHYADITVAAAEAHLEALPLIGGIAETVAALNARGILCVISTVSFAFNARFLCRRFGFHGHCGALMHEEDGLLLGRMSRHCSAEDKRDFVIALAAERGIPMTEVAHVGDSVSDLPLFAAAGRSIALNATAPARAAAHHAIDTEDLTDILPLLGFPREPV
jgi:phosphoserine phosphatase